MFFLLSVLLLVGAVERWHLVSVPPNKKVKITKKNANPGVRGRGDGADPRRNGEPSGRLRKNSLARGHRPQDHQRREATAVSEPFKQEKNTIKIKQNIERMAPGPWPTLFRSDPGRSN